MRALDHKLLRDVFRMRGQLGAIALIVASAVATWVSMRGNYEALKGTQAAFYEEYRFPHVFASLERAPEAVAARIRALDGVAAVETRVVYDVNLDVPRLDEPATGRLISIPLDETTMLNRIHLRAGRMPERERDDEVVASERFSKENELVPGSTLSAVINGRWKPLRIVGVGVSPEYINEVRGDAAFPDYRRFGILWMRRDALAPAYSMEGAFNDVSIVLAPGAREADVISATDRILAPYGGRNAYGRDDQFSHRFIRSEIAQDEVTATTIPVIFMIVAAMLIHIVMSRLVAGERAQIATMKAFGYRSEPIGAHYVKFALVTVLAGSLAGVPIGIALGVKLTALYREFFSFPKLTFSASATSIILAISVTAATAAAAAILSVRRAVAVPPAEGMRGEPPPLYTRTFVEPLHKLFSSAGRMVLRTIERRPWRAVLTIVGIAAATMILVVGRYSFDALDAIIETEFQGAQRDDATVTFIKPQPMTAISELRRLVGVQVAEPFRAAPVRIASGHRSRRIALLGLPAAATLRRITDAHGRQHAIPPSGVMLTGKLAALLGVDRGDTVRIELLEGRRVTADMPVVDIADELIGTNAYVSLDTMHQFLSETDAISGAYLAVERSSESALHRALKRLPNLQIATFREAMLASFRATVAENINLSMTLLIAFACVIAFGVIYNSARIALSERGRDLASLRVLGFSQREVAAMLFAEQALLTGIAIPIGFLWGRLIAHVLAVAFETDIYRLPEVISAKTYAFAFLIVAAASIASAAAVRHRIATLDLVEVLKSRE